MIRLNASRVYLIIGFLLSLSLGYIAGWRDFGLDRGDYIEMYNNILSTDEWEIRLWFAKDVLFLTVTLASNYFSDDPKLAFLVICILSMLLKYLSVRRLAPKYTLSYIFLYTIFLAPGLEFAAIRGGLAIGFFMIALSYRDRIFHFLILSVLTCLSHISTLLIVILPVRKFNEFLSKHNWSYALVTLIISLSSSLLLGAFPHGEDYENNRGTIFAYSEPLVTLIIAWLILYRLVPVSKQNINDPVLQQLLILRPIIYCLIAIAFGITGGVVTAATRYLEISWCLLLLAAIGMCNKSYVNMLGGLLFLAFLAYVNIIRLTWLAIIIPSLSN